jgi:hypothetical protein
VAVRNWTPDHGTEALEDEVHGDCLVDGICRLMEGLCEGRYRWEVDVGW